MRLTFGKYRQKLLEEILLTQPGYILWMLDVPRPDPKLQHVCNEVGRLVRIFDEKPFLQDCRDCHHPSTRMSITNGGYEINYWCADCRPRSVECYGEEIVVIDQYFSAVYLEQKMPPDFLETDPPLLLLAYAKGLAHPFEESDLERFFHGVLPPRFRNQRGIHQDWRR